MKRYADLHIHTCLSDGSGTAAQALALARKNNVSYLSITDHNTMAAYTREAWEAADRLGLRLISGVELDTIFKGKQFHLLAFGAGTDNQRLIEACAHNARVQEDSNLSLLRRMEKDGLDVREKEYEKYEIPPGRGGWKLLNYLFDAGMTKTLLEGLKYYGQYGVDSDKIPFVDLDEAVRIVKEASGVPVLAHPAEQLPYNPYEADHTPFWSALNELLETGMEGVECVHPLHSFGLQEELAALCRERGLFISGGTDYHGAFFSKQKQTIGGQMVGADLVGRLIDSVAGKG
jgi:hypothetical protein